MTIEEQQRQAERRPDPGMPAPVIARGESFNTVTDQITSIVLTRRPPLFWYITFGVGMSALLIFIGAVTYLFRTGVGIFGIEIPVAWGFAITNFVWWIGIGHAGTLISAILLLLNQSWRNSINRFAEAMTIFAVMCAGLFPILHLGRPWLFYWLVPYPHTIVVQPQFRSALVWDIFAVSTYATVSLLFWYLGMIPDLATFRDNSRSPLAYGFYGVLSLGWRGSSRHWGWHKTASILLAGLATPLVLSVHTVVSFDFSISILPGWHSTIFPPYFVAGAIYSGFAMILLLAMPLRHVYHLDNLITERHLDNCAKVMLATGLVLAYTYVIEPFTAWYSGDPFEMYVVQNRITGPHAWTYFGTLLCNVAIPQLLWFRKVRVSPKPLFLVAGVILFGMWLERYMIIITSLHHDYLPSAWSNFVPTGWDYTLLGGSIGLFVTAFMLFVRLLPMISMYEVREMLPLSSATGGSQI